MMKTIFFVLVLSAAKLTNAEDKQLDVTVTDSVCGQVYSTEYYSSFNVEYKGSLVGAKTCNLEVKIKDYFDKVLCITASKISISCDSSIEYHSSFIKEALDPEKTITCNKGAAGEWCSDQYVDDVFIVIKKTTVTNSDSVKLRLYEKYVTTATERFFKSGINIFLVAISPAVLIAVIMCVACYFLIRQRNRKELERRARFQTTMEAVTLQANQTCGTPSLPTAEYQTVSQTDTDHSGENLLQGYNIHPMQRAVPDDGASGTTLPNYPHHMSSSSAGGKVTYPSQRQEQPSAPAYNPDEPPPPYDKLLQK